MEMPFEMWSPVGPVKHVLDGGAHWRHLANTIEPSMCGGDMRRYAQTVSCIHAHKLVSVSLGELPVGIWLLLYCYLVL